MSKIEEAFRGLGRTEKVRFISQNIEYANAVAVASYVKGYLFDVLNDVGDDEYIACLLYTSPSPRDRTRSRMPSSA